jgi:DNA-binding response OmpR family regulator
MAKRILAVDDDQQILDLERTILTAAGFEVEAAQGGEGALALLAEGAFDVVLMDVMMPGMDGFELCRRIKQDPRHQTLPVVFLTARGGGEPFAEGLDSGAAMYISKPFTAAKLLAVVRAALGEAPA